jgi:hypothetical protein
MWIPDVLKFFLVDKFIKGISLGWGLQPGAAAGVEENGSQSVGNSDVIIIFLWPGYSLL